MSRREANAIAVSQSLSILMDGYNFQWNAFLLIIYSAPQKPFFEADYKHSISLNKSFVFKQFYTISGIRID